MTVTREGLLARIVLALSLLGGWVFSIVWTATWPVIGIANAHAVVQGVLLWGLFLGATVLFLLAVPFLMAERTPWSLLRDAVGAFMELPTRRQKRADDLAESIANLEADSERLEREIARLRCPDEPLLPRGFPTGWWVESPGPAGSLRQTLDEFLMSPYGHPWA